MVFIFLYLNLMTLVAIPHANRKTRNFHFQKKTISGSIVIINFHTGFSQTTHLAKAQS